jgi:hypothetical protein
VSSDEALDFFDEVGVESKEPRRIARWVMRGEEAFDLVEPRGIGGREVNVPTRTAGEPSSDLGMLVGRRNCRRRIAPRTYGTEHQAVYS